MENELVKVFNYNGCPISFKTENGTMVNATEMAKPFGRSCNDWLRTEQSRRMINAISTSKKCDVADLVKITNGGNIGNGTWMQEDVAMVFAQWLSPDFYIWCNDRIKELMKFGVTATTQMMEQMINNPDALIIALEALKKERKEKAALAEENKQKQLLIEQNKPKVDFATAVENSETLILIRDLAKILKQNGYDTGEVRLYETLRRDGYLTLGNSPTQRSMELKVMRVVENVVTTPFGSKVKTTPKITGKGQVYFCNRYAGHKPIEGTLIFNQ